MITEWLADELDEAFVWRCVNCGALLDPMIERNHQQAMGTLAAGK